MTTVKATVIEREGEYGWGRVRLEDGRELTFDITACVDGRPLNDVAVNVFLAPSRTGGEYVASVIVPEEWTPVREVPFVVIGGSVHVIQDHGAHVDPPEMQVAGSGCTGYVSVERRVGITTHTSGKDIRRLGSHRVAPLELPDRAVVCRYLKSQIDEIEDVIRDEPGEDHADDRRELMRLRTALADLRPPGLVARILGRDKGGGR